MTAFPNQAISRKRNVLIVEDEEVNARMLAMILSERYACMTAGNGREALEMIRENPAVISLIMLDLNMPVMDGLTLLNILHNDSVLKRIPVIVLTSETKAEVQCLQYGAVDFIKKPYDMPDVILARVQRIIELAEDRQLIEDVELDPLSGLYTKQFFREYVSYMDRYNPDEKMDLIACNIDHFHLLNEMYGRAFGDQILRQIGEAVLLFLKKHPGLACRNEADQFYIYCRHLPSEDDLQELISAAARNDTRIRVRMRTGIFPLCDKSIDAETRMDNVKAACDSLRGDRSRNTAVYNPDLHNEELFQERLLIDMEDALREKQFRIYYQPKFDIRNDTPALNSLEALIRWDHPSLGLLTPGRFVPMFEKNGLVRTLDYYVWKETAAQLAEWKRKYGLPVSVSVNVSRIDLFDPQLPDIIRDIIESNGLQKHDLHLEITESAYSDEFETVRQAVQSLQNSGFLIEMDDFGTGYSSLAVINTLPVDILKLDMQFIKNIHTDAKSYELLKLLIGIARFIHAPVIAEGAETEEQVSLLKEAGCDIVQGYWFDGPLTAEQFEHKYLKERK